MSEYLQDNHKEQWNHRLEKFVADRDNWAAECYDSKTKNCFDFVLEFLKFIQIKSVKDAISCKTTFCEQFIVPRTRLLARYISLYRKLKADSVVILHST